MTTTISFCAVCGDDASQWCSGCPEGRDNQGNMSTIHYCSKKCQAADWPKHKTQCKLRHARKILFRGADLMQQAFYAFREEAFDLKVTAVKREGDFIILEEAYVYDIPGSPLYRFPSHMVQDEADKRSILVFNACSDALVYPMGLFDKVLEGDKRAGRALKSQLANDVHLGLKGYITEVKELTLIMDKRYKRIKHYRAGKLDEHDYPHEAILIVLTGGENFVLDLAGAQYGQYESIVTWDNLKARYVKNVVQVNERGARAQYCKDRREGNGYDHEKLLGLGFDIRVLLMHHEVMQLLNSTLSAWEKESGTTVAQMLAGKQVEIETQSTKMLAKMRAEMKGYITWAESVPRLFGQERVPIK